MAVDLRFITSVMKINADLERVGDQAVNIAERVMNIVKLPSADLPWMFRAWQPRWPGMCGARSNPSWKRKRNWRKRCSKWMTSSTGMDDEFYAVLVNRMHQEPEITDQALDVLLISRNLERVADHATNIAEDVIFWVKGADIRHNAADHAASE